MGGVGLLPTPRQASARSPRQQRPSSRIHVTTLCPLGYHLLHKPYIFRTSLYANQISGLLHFSRRFPSTSWLYVLPVDGRWAACCEIGVGLHAWLGNAYFAYVNGFTRQS